MTDRGWALVTGAARRIGRTLALTAAQAGYDVLVHHHHSPDDAAETVRQIEALARRALAVQFDLASESLHPLIAAAPGPVTLLVNCASLFDDDRIRTLTPQSWDAA